LRFSSVKNNKYTQPNFLYKQNVALIDNFVRLWSTHKNTEKYELFFDSFVTHFSLFRNDIKRELALIVYDPIKYAVVVV